MNPVPPSEPQDKPLVLVIDDELGPRESLRFLLKDQYQVRCADSVKNGLNVLHETPPDLVILDIRMPVKSGIEGLREIRSLDPDVSVIMLTGFAALDTAQEAIRNEASDYMEKPFDALEMRRAVRHYVEQTRLRRKRNALLHEADALDSRIRKLQEANRMVELGQSSAEFVHDLRNVLATISGSSSLLRMEVEDMQHRTQQVPDEVHRYLDSLESSMQRCVEMLDTWQRMIQDTPHQLSILDVHTLASDCADACRPVAHTLNATLLFEGCGEPMECQGDRVQIERLLSNLIQNALKALPGQDGRVVVRAQRLESSVLLSVSDNGCGIPEEHLERVFDPDFSTRRDRGGMGLGLFIARKIVQAHNGTLTVESVVGEGSSFHLTLPLALPGGESRLPSDERTA